MILVMTASVKTAKINQLCIRDTEIRLKQYCDALRFYIKSKKFDKIVFCDNSNYGYEYDEEQRLAKKKNVLLEILKFSSNYELVEKYGKGYGEGEILKYVIENSCLLKEEEYFYKVTGRLIIKNISALVKKNNMTACFNRNLYADKSFDTRFWGIKKNDYIQCLLESYKRVNDDNGRYLEMCYKRDLEKATISYKSFNKFPIINGYSGTIGKKYHEVTWYTKIVYDFLCFFNIYNSERGFLVAYLLYHVVICKRTIMDVFYSYLINNV